MGKRGPKPKRAANPQWTTDLAYACGLMASDGCVISDGRHLNLTSKDIDQLETFKKCLGINVKISWKPSTFAGALRPQVQFSDATLHRWFVSIGITPHKSKTIRAILIPDKFFFDYLRGEFDGDGHSNAYWDTRWRSSVSLYIGFSSASEKHLQWLKTTIQNLIGIAGIVKLSQNCHKLEFSKTKAEVLYKYMYHTDNIPYLKRKKEKLDRQWQAVSDAKQGKQPVNFVKNGPVLRIA